MTAFALHRHGDFSIQDTEAMMPWERNLYLDLVVQALEAEKKAMEDARRS
jgi:hypothetical protein